MSNFSDRLKEERLRLGLNQAAFGEMCGVKLQAQHNYESGLRKPDSGYLEAAADAGVDIQYLFTGKRAATHLNAEENLILERYRESGRSIKDAAMRVLILGEGTTEAKVVNVIATGGQAAGRNIKNVSIGSVTHDSSKSKGPPRSSSRSRHT